MSSREPRPRDRAILGLLLAFLVWTLLPAFEMRAHRHAGDAAFHTHRPAVRGTALGHGPTGGDEDRAPAPPGARIELPAAGVWHCHLGDPFHHVSVGAPLVFAPRIVAAALVAVPLAEPPTDSVAAANARAPPLRQS